MTLPAWAQVTPERRGHIERVVALVRTWADVMAIPAAERDRWVRAGWLHDALRDASPPFRDALAHGPAAADRAATDGEQDAGVLAAVRYHTVGFAGWDDAGRMLYLADYLEPGRPFERESRAALAARVPRERDIVLREVTRRRIERLLESGWSLPSETVAFWNRIAGAAR